MQPHTAYPNVAVFCFFPTQWSHLLGFVRLLTCCYRYHKKKLWDFLMESTWRLITRTTHAYDTSHHSKHHAAWMGRATQVSGIVRLVGVQRTVQKNGNVKSEANTWLVKNLQYVLSTSDSTLSCSSVPLLASTAGWLLCLFFLELPAVGCVQHSTIHGLSSANTYVAKGQPCCLPYHPSSCIARIRYPALPQAHKHQLTFRAWPQIDIPKCDRHMHTYIARTDPSFKASC